MKQPAYGLMLGYVSGLESKAEVTLPPVLDDVPTSTSGSTCLKLSRAARVTRGEVMHWIELMVLESTLQAVLQTDTMDPMPEPLTFRVPKLDPVLHMVATIGHLVDQVVIRQMAAW